jgi:hypothetical protein
MPEYSERIDVAAPAEAVFRFVSNVENLPKYLPTVHTAHPQGRDRVEVDGEANGHPYKSDGWFKADPDKKTMSWGSDGENDYAGRMTVTSQGAGSTVECALRFTPKPAVKNAMDERQGGPSAAMTDGLRASLQSIKLLCEGSGGKMRSSAE